MPMPAGAGGQGQPISCFSKMKMGFLMGCCVGMGSGLLLGGFTALRHGLRGRELVQQVGTVMFQGAGTFGTFMSVGTMIRC